MKIKVTVYLKGRRFRAESDDELENMAEVEAVSDIFSAIGYMAEDIYAVEPKEEHVQKYARWTVDYEDIPVSSSAEDNNSIAWSDKVRIAVYAIIKVVYGDHDISPNCPIPSVCNLANPPFTPAYNPYGLIPSYRTYIGINGPLTPIEMMVLMSLPEENYNSLIKQDTRLKILKELLKLETEIREKQKRRDNKE